MKGNNPNGKGVCRFEDALEACEYIDGNRIDSLYKTRIENRRLLAEFAKQKQSQAAEVSRQAAVQAAQAAAQDEARETGGFQWGKASALLGGSTIGGLGKLAPEIQAKVISGILQDSMDGQDGIGNFQGAVSAQTTFAVDTPAQGPTAGVNVTPAWKTCGPQAECLVGDGYAQFCSGPYDSSKPPCESECSMDSGVIYHDTTLPANRAYIGTGKNCRAGTCNVVNSCG